MTGVKSITLDGAKEKCEKCGELEHGLSMFYGFKICGQCLLRAQGIEHNGKDKGVFRRKEKTN